MTGFLGPNGAGKSTTMRMILGLDRPTRRQRDGQRAPLRRLPRAAARGRRAARGAGAAPRALRPRPPALARGQQRHPGARGSTRCWTSSASRRSPAARRHVLPRHGPAARHRRRAARRPAGRGARRAGQRPRPRGHPLGAHLARQLADRGPHRVRVQPPDVRDGADRRPPRRHRPRPAAGRLLHDRVHRRPRRLLRAGPQPPARRGRRTAPPFRPGRRRPGRRAAGAGARRRRRRRADREERAATCTS